jgi:hypothetical protein
MLALGYNLSLSTHRADSGLMELPAYQIGFFSKHVSYKGHSTRCGGNAPHAIRVISIVTQPMKPEFLKTIKKESWKSWWFRLLMNWYPMYFGTGGKILFWAADSTEVHLRLRLNIWSYNYVGTIFGGSMFSAADPFYMVMLLKVLGNDYVVWDKAANIRFKNLQKKLYTRPLRSPTKVWRILKSGWRPMGIRPTTLLFNGSIIKKLYMRKLKDIATLPAKSSIKKERG